MSSPARRVLALALARAHDLAAIGELDQELAPEIGDHAAFDDDLLFSFAPGGHRMGGLPPYRSKSASSFAAQMKSFSERPLIACVW